MTHFSAIKPRKKKKFQFHKLMLLPALALFLVFVIFPIAEGIILAFTDWDGYNAMNFIGLQNFVRFFRDDQAYSAVKNTIFFGIGGTLLLNIVGLLYALLLDSKIKLKGVLRTLVYMPAIISPLIIGYIWMIILSSENGLYINILRGLNAEHLFQDLLADPKKALFVIVFVHVWQYVGGNMIIYLAGLQNVSNELLEAARIDGASSWQQLRFVKLPLLVPSFRINIITNIIGAMSMFDVIMSLTNGGPGHYTESLSIFIYRLSTSNQAGYTAAVSVIMFIIILIPAGLAFKMMQKMDVEV